VSTPAHARPLELEPEPQSVKVARSWVVEALRDLGRDDVLDAAELGVSELVTNAILHAEPPITVQVRGTRRHPRVEVHDRSSRPPSADTDLTGEERLLSTVGRGMGIVALYSTAWGAEVSAGGKLVWFEPGAEPTLDAPAGDVFDLAEAVDQRLAGRADPGERVRVRLLGMPVRVFADFRAWYVELRRELRLLALAHGTDYPVASAISELVLQVEQERRQASGVDRLDEAIAAGVERVDLDYDVVASAPATMGRLVEALDRADAFCRDQRLLALAATEQQAALWHWYLGEFIRQAAGGPPTAWPGGYTVEVDG
jgi:anti-sigma regulatory factor (Ser/Thr protein kinase)